jgi:hypothetical protein
MIGAGLREVGEIALRLDNHQVHIERLLRAASYRFELRERLYWVNVSMPLMPLVLNGHRAQTRHDDLCGGRFPTPRGMCVPTQMSFIIGDMLFMK